MKKSLLIIPAVLALGAAYYLVAGMMPALPSGAPVTGPPIDQAALMRDVQTLSSAPFAGRRAGSAGSKLAQEYIIGRFQKIGVLPFGAGYAMPLSFSNTNEKGERIAYAAVNLVGHIKGVTYPDRVIVVSAHYDHLGVQEGVTFPGADDNASGVGAMLAIATHFKSNPPRNTIVFAAFDAEELGLQGARALLKAPPFPLGQLRFNLNLDMVGRSDKNEIFAVGSRYTPELKPMVAAVAAGSPLKVRLGHDRPALLAGGVEDWTESSDHAPFHFLGIPFLYFGVEDHADYHGPGDTADKIKPEFYTEATRLLVRMAAHIDENLMLVR